MSAVHPPRLAIVLSHPTQYYSPWFAWIAAHTELSFRVFYLWDFGVRAQRDVQFGTTFRWDRDLLAGYEHEFVPNTASRPGTDHFSGLRNPTLPARLAAWNPDAVLLFGYKSPAHLRAIAWCRRHRVPLVFRGDSHFLGGRRPSLGSRLMLRLIYAQFAAFLPVGAANRDYFTALGVPEQKLFFAPHAVDDTLFDPSRTDHQAAATALRRTLELDEQTRVLLFAGKFVAAKQPRELLEAFLRIRSPNTALVMVGDGPESGALQSIARGAPAGTVHFLPFANQTEMPARYLLADVFALPSRGLYETWGLAVNEAMHMGVPALVSDRVGCQRDLVTHGETGWTFPATDTNALERRLAEALVEVADVKRREALRLAVRARIGRYTYSHATQGLLAALAALQR